MGGGFKHDWPRIVRKLRRTGAHLLVIDESGLMMLPLVRRTLAPQGHTPVLTVKASHREKVSLIAGLTLSPRRQRIGLHYRAYPKVSVNHVRTAAFLRQVLRQVRGPVVVLWDRGNMHKGPALRTLIERHPRLSTELLPPYAPELNPVEQLWNHLKYDDLANYTPHNVTELAATTRKRLERTRNNHHRLRTLFTGTPLIHPQLSTTVVS